MKSFKIILVLLFTTLSISIFAQSKQVIKSDTLKVWGNCDMCQEKIEKAAKKVGAVRATWDVDSKILTVAFNPAKVSMEKIEQAIATVGYDTEHLTATTKAYNALPGCCQYERKGTQVKN